MMRGNQVMNHCVIRTENRNRKDSFCADKTVTHSMFCNRELVT